MIDPLEAAVKFLLAQNQLSSLDNRIASKHRYGEEWTADQASLVVVLDDSSPDLYVQKHDVRLEVSSYAADDATAMDTWMALIEISRNVERVVITTSNGNALVYSFKPESGPSYLPDKDLETMKRIMSFWRIQVSEVAVP
jgi:hypothetical protein